MSVTNQIGPVVPQELLLFTSTMEVTSAAAQMSVSASEWSAGRGLLPAASPRGAVFHRAGTIDSSL